MKIIIKAKDLEEINNMISEINNFHKQHPEIEIVMEVEKTYNNQGKTILSEKELKFIELLGNIPDDTRDGILLGIEMVAQIYELKNE